MRGRGKRPRKPKKSGKKSTTAHAKGQSVGLKRTSDEQLRQAYATGKLPGMDASTIAPVCTKYFREGQGLHPLVYNFIFMHGGMGDYICWSVAIRYIEQFYPHVMPKLFVADWCKDIIENFFNGTRVEVYDRSKFDDYYIDGSPVLGNIESNQLLNATGTHLVDLGFSYFLGRNPPPPEADLSYIPLDLESIDISHIELPESYCVFTPGATNMTRHMPVEAFNLLKDYCISLGVTPVFLGKAKLTPAYRTNFKEGYDYTGGINLLDKTGVLEAGKIIAGARFILGVDNGLLHLAACTEVPIIFGYTITGPEMRRPIRKKGLTLDITVPHAELSCINCQENIRFIPGHRFTRCLYNDTKCCELLFKEGASEWKKAIDLIMKEY